MLIPPVRDWKELVDDVMESIEKDEMERLRLKRRMRKTVNIFRAHHADGLPEWDLRRRLRGLIEKKR